MSWRVFFFVLLTSHLPACGVVRAALSEEEGCSEKQAVEWVNPFIGTCGDHGQLHPSAMWPFGLVKLGPETSGKGQSGYQYEAKYIYGFSHVRVDGSGCEGAGGNILIKPMKTGFTNIREQYRESYDKNSERASPGYYRVELSCGIECEMTVSERVGLHKYNFGSCDNSYILVDLSHSHAGMLDAKLRVESADEVCGMVKSRNVGWHRGGDQHFKLYFSIKFSEHFEKFITWKDEDSGSGVALREGKKIGGWFEFSGGENKVILAKVGISPVSVEQAKEERRKEVSGWDFEALRYLARQSWQEKLSKVEVNSKRDDLKTLFYTLLYRSYAMPVNVTSSSGEYRPAQNECELRHTSSIAEDFVYYSGWDIWGDFRHRYMLLSITEPRVMKNMARSLVEYYRERGGVMRDDYSFRAEGYWPCPTTRQEFAGVVILDALQKGLIELSKKELEIAYSGIKEDFEIYREGTFADQLEKVFNAYLAMKMAWIVGDADEYKKYRRKALSYRQLWNPDQRDSEYIARGFFTPEGKNVKDVLSIDKHAYEGNLWHYRWFVPHDMEGLIKLRGSREAFANDLEYFFDNNIYMHLNQPDIQAPFLFNYAGKPWLSQKWSRKYTTKTTLHRFHNHGFFEEPVIRPAYVAQPRGYLPTMDDDQGSMASWFVLSAMGLFPGTPGDTYYLIGSPIFPELKINLTSEKTFVIKANNVSESNFYIHSARLNGKSLKRALVEYDTIKNGGILEFEMSSEPNKFWASQPEYAPPSMSDLDRKPAK